jgi:DNA-binding response OmpR family regulator
VTAACKSATRVNWPLKTIAGDTYYDLLLFDNSLPSINGLNLLQQSAGCRIACTHRFVILLSDPIGDEGLRAGANAVLFKPEDISAIAETITRLLKTASKTAEHRPADPGPRIDYSGITWLIENRGHP